MIGLFRKRKLKRDVEKLEVKLLSSLKDHFPDLAENHSHWNLSTVFIFDVDEKIIQLMHMTTDLDYEKQNKVKHRKNFKINGVEIIEKQSGKFIPIKIHVYGNLIQHIFLPIKNRISKQYDIDSVRVKNLKTEILKTENPDKITLLKILKELDEDKLKQMDITDTFEIDVDDKLYYTVFDMEDGRYIAVDKLGRVYRLIHDHENPVKKIADNINILLESYSGDKKKFEEYMVV